MRQKEHRPSQISDIRDYNRHLSSAFASVTLLTTMCMHHDMMCMSEFRPTHHFVVSKATQTKRLYIRDVSTKLLANADRKLSDLRGMRLSPMGPTLCNLSTCQFSKTPRRMWSPYLGDCAHHCLGFSFCYSTYQVASAS